MNPTQREPFTTGLEPFTLADAPLDGAESIGCDVSNVDVCDTPDIVPDERDGVVSTVHVVDDTDTVATARTRVKISAALPNDTRWRLRVIASYEDRSVSEVVDSALREFIANPNNDPRPYIPPQLLITGCTRTGYEVSSDLIPGLDERAMTECRDKGMLIHRAILDYIDRSPGNPNGVRE